MFYRIFHFFCLFLVTKGLEDYFLDVNSCLTRKKDNKIIWCMDSHSENKIKIYSVGKHNEYISVVKNKNYYEIYKNFNENIGKYVNFYISIPNLMCENCVNIKKTVYKKNDVFKLLFISTFLIFLIFLIFCVCCYFLKKNKVVKPLFDSVFIEKFSLESGYATQKEKFELFIEMKRLENNFK